MFFPEIAKLIVNDVSPNGNHDDQNHKANSGWEDVSREGGGGGWLFFGIFGVSTGVISHGKCAKIRNR